MAKDSKRLYQPYEEKILKLAKIKAWIIKHIALLTLACVALVSGISALLYFKGDITTDLTLNAQYTYGDVIENTAKAFLAKPKMVFYMDGVPVDDLTTLGEYSVRVETRSGLGVKKYGEWNTFTLQAKTANLMVADCVVYGDELAVSINGLISSDSFMKDALNVEYRDIFTDDVEVKIDPDSVVIHNKTGKNVTACYDIQGLSKQWRDILLLKRAIEVQTGSDGKVYDGEWLQKQTYELTYGSLAGADVMIVNEFASIRDVGEKANEANVLILSKDGQDMTALYDVSLVYGLLNVTPRAFTIATESASKVYDGTPLEQTMYKTNGCAQGHFAVIHDYASLIEPGKIANVFQYDIFDEQGNVVTDNYDKTHTWGELKVYAGEVSLQVNENSVYDGQVYDKAWYTYTVVQGVIRQDHDVQMRVSTYDANARETQVKNAGTYKTVIENCTIYQNGNDVTDLYILTFLEGAHVVHKRVVEAQFSDAEKYYDGTPLKSTKVFADNLVYGHTMSATSVNSLLEPGVEINRLYERNITIKDESGNDVTSNYQCNTHDGYLYVYKRDVTLFPLPLTKVYDNTTLVYPDGLAAEMRIVCKWTAESDLHEGKALLASHRIQSDGVAFGDVLVDVGSTELSLLNARILDANGNDVTDKYYEVTLETSVASVSQSELWIAWPNQTDILDSAEQCYMLKGALVEGQTVEYAVQARNAEYVLEVMIRDGEKIVGYAVFSENGMCIEGNTQNLNYHIQVHCNP